MGRSAVLTGRIDARDRAKLRHRIDRAAAVADDPYDLLSARLNHSAYADRPDDVARLDTDEFLRFTGDIDLPPEERLRHLAIFLEEKDAAHAPHLDRIYQSAIRLTPNSAVVWHSRGITAKLTATVSDESRADRAAKLALRCLHRAFELDDGDPGITYSLGKWDYELGDSVEEAATWFDRTLALDPNHGYARLYRAHCLHDMERWPESVSAYEAVPLDTFEGDKAWLVDVVLEALAYCRLRAGDRSGALRDFARLLERFEKEPHRTEGLLLQHLTKACRGPLRTELWSRYLPLARAVGLPA